MTQLVRSSAQPDVLFLKLNIYRYPYSPTTTGETGQVSTTRQHSVAPSNEGRAAVTHPYRAPPASSPGSLALTLLPVDERPALEQSSCATAVTALTARDPAMLECWCFCSHVFQQDQLPGGSKGSRRRSQQLLIQVQGELGGIIVLWHWCC